MLIPKLWRLANSRIITNTWCTSPRARLGLPPGRRSQLKEGTRLCNVAHIQVLTERLILSVTRQRCSPPPFHSSVIFMQRRQEYIRAQPQNSFRSLVGSAYC